MDHEPSGATSRQACPVCARVFDRPEHLKRHLATHSMDRNCVCRVCGRRFSRKDALDRHQNVHRPRVPLRRFRACTECANSRVKCSGGVPPCTRCDKKSLACHFPEGLSNKQQQRQHQQRGAVAGPACSERDDDGDDIDIDLASVRAGAAVGPQTQQTPYADIHTYADPPSTNEEMQQTMIVAQQHQRQQQQQQQQQQQHSVATASQERQRTDAYLFLQQHEPIQPDELMLHETNTYMTRMSTLNWISPTMDFDLADFDYNPTAASDEPYGGSSTSVNDLSNQTPSAVSQTTGTRPIGAQSHSPPGTGNFPQDSNVSETFVVGTAYVDSKGARRPRNGRYANRVFDEASPSGLGSPRSCPEREVLPPVMAPEPDGFTFMLRAPFSNLPAQEFTNTQRVVQPFSLEQYRAMCHAFQDHCWAPNDTYLHDGPFFSTELPSISTFATLLALYRQCFDPKVLPMIHPGLDSENTSCWVVKLAMSAIGSQYLETSPVGHTELAVALHEFLRRVLLQRHGETVFSTEMLTIDSLGLVQSKLLNYIGLAYGGSRRLERHRTAALENLVAECTTLHRTQPMALRDDDMGNINLQQGRRDWILAESARRLCHAIWFIDSSSRYHFGMPSTLLLDFADIALPCKEDAWQAEAEAAQMQASTPITKQPTLEKVLRVLYVEKRLLEGIGDFARVLIIHGLYCQTWDVAKLLHRRPLLRWTPSAQKENAESQQLTGPPWLPQIPLYNLWRNAACDCLDVLHWIANSDIAKAGTENATVLHLHCARIVLLAPYETVRAMAELLAASDEDVRHGLGQGNAAAASGRRFQEYCKQVQRWITDDQFKARLALVHCGVVFWHVRRYATDAFYEPTTVFLATLVVWAYGSLCPPRASTATATATTTTTTTTTHNNRSSRDGGEWSSDLDDISSIRLDRPTDDELVQIFIKRGRSMKATIMGVGNITAANGPVRMLREGCKLLNTLDKWPLGQHHLHVLTRLMDVCRQDKDNPGKPWLPTGFNTTTTLTRQLDSTSSR